MHGLVEDGRGGGEQVQGFTDVAVGGGDPDAEARGQAGLGVTVAQMCEDQQRLTLRVQPPPMGTGGATGGAEQVRQVGQGRTRQRDRGSM